MDAGLSGWFFGLFGVFFVFVWVLVIGGTVLWIWMLVDCVQVPDDRFYRSGSKLMWVLIIALTQVIGALIYLGVGRPTKETRDWLAAQRAAGAPQWWGPPGQGQAGTPQPPPGAPQAPAGSAQAPQGATVPPPPPAPPPGADDA